MTIAVLLAQTVDAAANRRDPRLGHHRLLVRDDVVRPARTVAVVERSFSRTAAPTRTARS